MDAKACRRSGERIHQRGAAVALPPLDRPSGRNAAMPTNPTHPSGCFAATLSVLFALAASDRAVAQCAPPDWVALGAGTDSAIEALLPMPNGDLVVGGYFTSAGGTPAEHIARWDGASWSTLGSGMNGAVLALLALPNGDIVAGGVFTQAGGNAANYIARWDGASWSPIGTGMNNGVASLLRMPNGDIVAGGFFATAGGASANRIARWNGASWSSIGAGMDNGVSALTTLANGDIVAGGTFFTAGGVSANRVARWDGSSWSSMAWVSSGSIGDFATLQNGDLVAGGVFGVERWDGSNWSPIGTPTGQLLAMTQLPNGDLVIGGNFLGVDSVRANRVARWNGSTWSPLDDGFNSTVRVLTTMPNGDLIAGGDFSMADVTPASKIARLSPPCPVGMQTFAPGCNSSGGNNTLTTTSPPWANGTFRATGTGLPAPAFVLAVTSVTSIVPAFALDSVFAEALPGCNLHVAPDILETLFTTTGTAQSQLFLPNTPPILGVTFYHQMVPIEVDAMLAFVEITSTNALALTVGGF